MLLSILALRESRGEITSRVSEDVAEIRWAIAETLPEILCNIILVVGTLTVLFWVSRPLARGLCHTAGWAWPFI